MNSKTANLTTIHQSLAIHWYPFLQKWWPVVVGLLCMYIPTYNHLFNGLWQTQEQAHGPLIFFMSLYLVWQNREYLLDPEILAPRLWLGSFSLIFGLLLYILGRSQDILIFDIGSQIPVLIGILLITQGFPIIKRIWFPLFFMVFMIPLPSMIVDTVTSPLKQHISEIAESLLYIAGYPIARSGVTLSIGQYQLLVADACSGLHSMFSLTALGFLYVHLMQHRNWLRIGIIIASLLPIAFIANVIRVITLVLVTYYMGDDAGQGFLHQFAGMLLFIISLLFLFTLDKALGWLLPANAKNYLYVSNKL